MQQEAFLPFTTNPHTPRVALVHDFLIQDGGAERVLATIQELYPDAPTYTLFYDPERAHPAFRTKRIMTSHLQRWPLLRGREHWALPLMPAAMEQFDFSAYDLVISSSSSFAKGVIVPPHTRHVCYLHTPTRFLWQDRTSYIDDLPQPRLIKSILPHVLHRMRMWDRVAADRPDVVLTNSRTSQERIQRYYGRTSHILYPPVDVDRIPLSTSTGSYWLTGGRLVGYKRFDLTVKAFTKLNLPLHVFGTGPEYPRLRRIAGPTVTFLGHVSEEEKHTLYKDAIGFIHPQIEDFGITAIEAMAAGRPVLAFGQGGATETIIPGVTGQLFHAQTWEEIGDVIIRFRPDTFDPHVIRRHAETFSRQQFQQRFKEFIASACHNATS
jgi:glycosyltransferase involved in cell wall biosynthesis